MLSQSKFSKLSKLIVTVTTIAVVSGCAAVGVAVGKRNLDIQTKTSTAVFVDAVSPDKRTVYAEIRSGIMEFDRRAFQQNIREEFAANGNGYKLIDDPEKAQYHLNIFVTTLEKASPTAAEAALRAGYSDVGAAAGAGAVLGAERGGTAGSMVGGGILAAVGVTAANAFVQDVTYLLVADVKITEKTRDGVIVRKDSQISAKVSDAGTSTQRVSEATNRKEYTTRIVTTANQANLKLEEAQPLMFKKTAYAMSGFF